ncbi:MAG: hypothetical protein K940chlam8_00272 [Chlamydiae bacterium]|nr:hypothetical protein [Chlamydiota bacterium]
MKRLVVLLCFLSIACAQEGIFAFPEVKQANTQKNPVKHPSTTVHPKTEGFPVSFAFGYEFLLSRIVSPRSIYALSMAPDFVDLTIVKGEAHFVGFNFTDAHRAFLSLGTHENFFWAADGFYLKDRQTRSTQGIVLIPFLTFFLGPPLPFETAVATSKVSLQYLDGLLFYSGKVSRYFIFEPFIGGRFLHHSNSFNAVYTDSNFLNAELVFKNQINGGGIVVGSGGKFMLSPHVYFFGNFSLNGIVGRQKYSTELDVPQSSDVKIIDFPGRRLKLLTGLQYAVGCGVDLGVAGNFSTSFRVGYEHMTYFKVTSSDFLLDVEAPEDFDMQAVTFGLAFGY